jgi:transcriptional regulator with XRE-family HTH domain
MRAKDRTTYPALAIRTEAFRRIGRDRLRVDTDTAIAARLGMDRAALSDLLHGKVQPSGPTIAMILATLRVPFEDVFDVRLAVPRSEPAPVAQAA